jgi:NAD(P)-dependent dehydrogenase (short-subunit alcohol dehydrogenase family)
MAKAPQAPAERVVLVTGAAKRLGREIALACARSGWRVAVHFRDSQGDAMRTVMDCAQHAMDAAGFQADLSNEMQTLALVPQVVGKMGRLDAIVNSAALFEHDEPKTFTYDSMHKHLAINTAAPILLAQALRDHLDTRQAGSEGLLPQGCIVNLLDQKLWNQNPDFMSYTLSKAALEAAGTMLALSLAPRVRVVGVAPGLTLTSHMLADEKFKELHKLSPLGRSSTP